jgi:hypothetical protein
MNFVAGVYVFPGGGVRKDDYSEEMLMRCGGLSLAPPTLTMLESLLAFDSWQSFSTKYRLR